MMWTTIIIGVLLLAGFGLYADLPRGGAVCKGNRDVDETPAVKEEQAYVTGSSEYVEEEYVSDEPDDAPEDPDLGA